MFLKVMPLMKCTNCTLDCTLSVRFQNFIIASSLFLIIQPGVSETSDQTKIYFISNLSCIFNAKDLIMLPQSALNLSFLVSLVTVDDNKDLVAVGNLINLHGSWFLLSFKLIHTSSYAVLALATMTLLKIILIKQQINSFNTPHTNGIIGASIWNCWRYGDNMLTASLKNWNFTGISGLAWYFTKWSYKVLSLGWFGLDWDW